MTHLNIGWKSNSSYKVFQKNWTLLLLLQVVTSSFQSQKRLYNRKCLFVRPSVSLKAKPFNSLKSSSFIFHLSSFFNHPSSFFIHPSFILRLLRFSASFFLIFSLLIVVITIIKIYLALYLKKCFLEGVWDPPFFLVFAIWPLKLCLCAVVL